LRFSCADAVHAHRLVQALSGGSSVPTIGSIGDEAALLAFNGTEQYPNAKLFFIAWRKGVTDGAVGVEAPVADTRVNEALASLLATRAAARQ
jgi:hypothetical protein